MFSLICVWINGWVNNREAGDLRRHRGHFDVNVMQPSSNRMDNCWGVLYMYITIVDVNMRLRTGSHTYWFHSQGLPFFLSSSSTLLVQLWHRLTTWTENWLDNYGLHGYANFRLRDGTLHQNSGKYSMEICTCHIYTLHICAYTHKWYISDLEYGHNPCYLDYM